MLWLQFSNVSMHLFDSLVPEWKQCNLKYSRSESVPKPWWGTCQNCHDNSKFSSKILIQGANYSQKEWKKNKTQKDKGYTSLQCRYNSFRMGQIVVFFPFSDCQVPVTKRKWRHIRKKTELQSFRRLSFRHTKNSQFVTFFVISPEVYWVRVSVQVSTILI